jgi:hypothetical protein
MATEYKPKDELSKMLAERRNGDLDCSTNTFYPSSQLLNVQELDAVLGTPEGLDLPFFAYCLELRASLMWSFEGKSREQAVAALMQYEQPGGLTMNMDANRIIRQDTQVAPVKKHWWGRKKDDGSQ